LGYHANSELISVSGVKDLIDNDNPTLLYLFNDPEYENHVVVAYGYEIVDSNTYFLIHSGHHDDCLKSGDEDDVGIMQEIKVNALLSYGGGAWLETVSAHTHNFIEGYSLFNEKLHFLKCSECNLIKEESHKLVTKTSAPGYTEHYKECTVCGYQTPKCNGTIIYKPIIGTLTKHSGTCLKCEATGIDVGTHIYEYKLMNDLTHTKVCKTCKQSETKKHDLGATCNKYSDNKHSRTCNQCAFKVLEDHFYFGSWSKDGNDLHYQTCLNCSFKKTENHIWGLWSKESTSHKRTCNKCVATQSVNHSYSSWKDNGTRNHIRLCSVCGNQETGYHSYSSWKDNGTRNHVRSCSVCGNQETGTHSYSTWNKVDSNYHSHTCSQCGKKETASHNKTYGSWKNVANFSTCRERSVNCYTCNYSGKETDTHHDINFTTKKCTKCGYNRGY